MDQTSAPNRELYAESLSCVNKLAEYRRLRVFSGNNTIPSPIWLVLLTGGLITIAYTLFPRCEEHQGAVSHDSCADNNHNVNFGIDLYS